MVAHGAVVVTTPRRRLRRRANRLERERREAARTERYRRRFRNRSYRCQDVNPTTGSRCGLDAGHTCEHMCADDASDYVEVWGEATGPCIEIEWDDLEIEVQL